jgi:hypothetical protein
MECIRVFVYFNLHKKVFSIKALQGPRKGRVIGHAASVKLHDVTFKVSEAGRQRVLREKKKNVHAGAVGYLCDSVAFDAFEESLAVPVTYNPYRYSSFVHKETEAPVRQAAFAWLEGRSIRALAVQ